MAVTLPKLVAELNESLATATIPDYPNALNGLQLANRSGTVARVVVAVDACLPVLEAIAAMPPAPTLLIVHHGLFWSGLQRLEGSAFRKLDLALASDVAVYSSHIPLDVHPQWGNNAQLAAALGFRKTAPFFPWKGILLGRRADVKLSRETLLSRVADATGTTPHLCPGGPEQVRRVGIITGGAGSEIAAMAAEGVDTFITGEGPHWSYTMAEELGINVIYGGHYATETFGVKALAAVLQKKHRLPWAFIDHPTGL
jgi:dinuclear metal center YbgI/SA1388 family protein